LCADRSSFDDDDDDADDVDVDGVVTENGASEPAFDDGGEDVDDDIDNDIINMGEDGDLQILTTFSHNDESYCICRSLEPTLILAKETSSKGDGDGFNRMELFEANEESDFEIMDKIEQHVLTQLEEGVKSALVEGSD